MNSQISDLERNEHPHLLSPTKPDSDYRKAEFITISIEFAMSDVADLYDLGKIDRSNIYIAR
jgi:hypothetical protein